MQHNPTTLTAYNKFNDRSQGTLIGNWQEERELRDVTGVGRTIPGQHLSKTRADLFTKAPPEELLNRPINNTNERTLGAKVNEWVDSEGHVYGTGYNKAEEIPKIGPKTSKREEFFKEQILQELSEQERQAEEEANRRQFETTHKEQFYKKDPLEVGNVFGKRVMKTQNGVPIPYDQKDNEIMVDRGIREREQFLTDEELRKYLPKGESYLTQQPITFWKEKQDDGAFYMSKQNTQNPNKTFAKNNDFLKTFQDYKHHKD